jgi:LysR family transcriptional activator of nhaA
MSFKNIESQNESCGNSEMTNRAQMASEAAEWLNYHHLLRFRAIAREGGVTRASRLLRVSASTLSEQLAELEAWLGEPLFDRQGRALVLTDAGRAVLDHADAIHESGAELLDLFRRPGAQKKRRALRIGAVAPLSKNLQFDFIEPLLTRPDAAISVSAGAFEDLLVRLRCHEVDVVLSDAPAPPGGSPEVFNQVLGEVPAYLVGRMRHLDESAGFPACLKGVPLFLPARNAPLREQFELLLARAGVQPEVRGEVDDMALLRLLALSGKGLALTSAIVVERELDSDRLRQVIPLPGLSVRFHAVTVRRRLANPWIEEVVSGIQERIRRFIQTVEESQPRRPSPRTVSAPRSAKASQVRSKNRLKAGRSGRSPRP